MTVTPLQEVVADLAARLRLVEDELAVTRLLTSYGFAVDSNDADGCARLYEPDAQFWLDGARALTGREQLRTIVTSEAHQAILPGCAHVMGPFTVQVSGDQATATGYATVFVAESGGRQIWRQSFGRWQLSRRQSGWRIEHRESWAIGLPAGQDAARAALHVQLADG